MKARAYTTSAHARVGCGRIGGIAGAGAGAGAYAVKWRAMVLGLGVSKRKRATVRFATSATSTRGRT